MATKRVSVRLGMDGGKKFQSDMVETGTKSDQALKKIDDRLKELTRDSKQSAAGVQVLETNSNKLNRTFTRLSGLAGGISFAFLSREAIGTIADFEQKMAGVEAVTSANREEFASLRETARDMGAVTKFAAGEAAEGMEFLGRAGFNAKEIIEAIPATLNLAAAAEETLGLARASDIASNVVSTFRKEASETGNVVDILAFTSANANTNVEQLSEGLKLAGPIAAEFKVDLESVAAELGVLSNSGLQATLGGTGLRRVIKELANPSEELKRHMGGLTLEQDGLIKVMDQLKKSTISGGEAFDIFGDRGAPAFLVLRTGADIAAQLDEELRKADGSARKMADIRMDTITGQFTRLKSVVSDLTIGVGDKGLGGTIKETTSYWADFFEAFSKADRINSRLSKGTTLQDRFIKTNVELDKLRTQLKDFPTLDSKTTLANDRTGLFRARLRIVTQIEEKETQVARILKVILGDLAKKRQLEKGKSDEDLKAELENAKRFAEIRKVTLDVEKQLAGLGDTRAKDIFDEEKKLLESLGSSREGAGGEALQAIAKAEAEIRNLTNEKLSKLNDELLKQDEKSLASNAKFVASYSDRVAALVNSNEETFVAGELAKLNADATAEQRKEVDASARAFFNFQEQVKEAAKAEKELDKNRTSDDKFIDDLERQVNLIGATNEEIEKSLLLSKLSADATPERIDEVKRIIEQMQVLKRENKRDEEFRGRAKDIFEGTRTLDENLNRDLDELDQLLNQNLITADTFTRQTGILFEQYREDLKKAKGDTSDFEKDVLKSVDNVASGFQRDLTDSIGEALDGAGNEFDSFINVLKSFRNEVIRLSIAKPVASFFTDAAGSLVKSFFNSSPATSDPVDGLLDDREFSSKGNAFDRGRVQQFSKGGIQDFPSFFPMAKGIGSISEERPEGIFPLVRLTNGDLGVQGQNGGAPVFNLTVNNNTPAQVQSRETQNGSGGLDIELTILQAVADDINGGDGPVTDALGTTFGLQQQLPS